MTTVIPNTIEDLRAEVTDRLNKTQKDLRVIGWERWEDGTWEPIVLNGINFANCADNLESIVLYIKRPKKADKQGKVKNTKGIL